MISDILAERKPDVRMLHDMDDVLYDRSQIDAPNIELYYMYRDLSLSKADYQQIIEHRLRYDITIIPPGMLGVEYVKTAGHDHPNNYGELYEVLEGEAHYLLQKREGDTVSDVIVVNAGAGDKVIIPPGYGHVTINSSNKTLKMANWVCRDFSSIYDFFREKAGASYFLLKEGFIPNPRYENLPEIRFLKPTNYAEVGLQKNKEMYGLVKQIDKLEYLTKPEGYDWLFEKILG
ncbi:MAG: glucose-6-phosphate isomerase [Methanosarcinales archaeon]|nr:glucose-6-phosphate isomerase [Methanosarcinales archaeon]